MAITVVQTAHALGLAFSNGTFSTTVTFSSAVTAGNTLIATAGALNPATGAGIAINGVSDAQNDSFGSAVAKAGSGLDAFGNTWFFAAQVFMAANVVGGSTSIALSYTVAN